jgi:hypothetical protein
MAKVYHSLPLDEESLDGAAEEKSTRTLREHSGSFSVVARDLLAKHWIWLLHAILLSISMTLFSLSFCLRDVKPSDLTYTKLYSSYCTNARSLQSHLNAVVDSL